MVGEAERGVVLPEKIEDRRLVPARVPELDRDPVPLRQQREETPEPVPIGAQHGRQLEQHRAELFSQSRHAAEDEVEALLYAAELLHVGDEAGGLPGEEEILRRALAPRRHGFFGGEAVERVVDLRRGEAGPIVSEEVRGLERGGIEWPAPGGVVPARGTDAQRARHQGIRPSGRRKGAGSFGMTPLTMRRCRGRAPCRCFGEGSFGVAGVSRAMRLALGPDACLERAGALAPKTKP